MSRESASPASASAFASHEAAPRTIRRAQVGTMAAMIEVLRLRIAGCTVGSVWFTERPDANFLRVMSSMTRGPVDGSLSGNALRGLRMTIDYPRALAWFTRGR